MEKEMNNQRLLKTLVKVLTTLGACACAYIILTILSNYGQEKQQVKPKPEVPSFGDYFKNSEADEIIEAKIET